MKFLLDTRLLLWAAGAPDRLPRPARALIEDLGHELIFSSASIWEIAIKRTLERDDFRADPALLRRGLLSHGYVELPITGEHVLRIASLPPIHQDPFDRVLVAQASVEGYTLLTSDRTVAQYPGPIQQV